MVEGEPTPVQLAQVEEAAEKLLSNPVIETFVVRVES
jgi:phosphoribosylformylglycinamidine synthase